MSYDIDSQELRTIATFRASLAVSGKLCRLKTRKYGSPWQKKKKKSIVRLLVPTSTVSRPELTMFTPMQAGSPPFGLASCCSLKLKKLLLQTRANPDYKYKPKQRDDNVKRRRKKEQQDSEMYVAASQNSRRRSTDLEDRFSEEEERKCEVVAKGV